MLVGASGSGRVRRGKSDVVVGVKLELDAAKGALFNEGALSVHVDCSAVSATIKDHKDVELEYAMSLEKALSRREALDLRKLCVAPGEQGLAWHIYLDAVVLDDDGSLLDVLSVAAFLALKDLKIPKVTPSKTISLSRVDFRVSDDPFECVEIDTTNAPIFVSVASFGSMLYVVDPSREEETTALNITHIAVNKDGVVMYNQMSGSSGVSMTQLFETIEVAKQATLVLITATNAAFEEEKKRQRPKQFLKN